MQTLSYFAIKKSVCLTHLFFILRRHFDSTVLYMSIHTDFIFYIAA